MDSHYIDLHSSVQLRSMTSKDEKKSRYVNTSALGSSVTYDTIDYEVPSKENRRNEHVYRDLKTQQREREHLPVKTVTSREQGDIARAPRTNTSIQLPVKAVATRKQDDVVRASDRRILYAVIAILVLLLIAAAVAFTLLYLKSKSDSSTADPKNLDSDIKASTTGAVTSPPTPRDTTVEVLSSSSEESPRTNTTMSTTTTTMAPLTISDQCQTYDGLIPHPVECQAYYNCSNDVPYYRFEKYMQECPYPQLFSTETMSCEHFEKVTCGNRTEAKDGCDYRATWCLSHCSSCDFRFPRCSGKNDGFHANEQKLWSPYYIICYKERFVTEMSCSSDTRLGLTQLFSPEYNGCVSLDRIPPEHGGIAPNCTGKPDGNYPNEYTRCYLYTECMWEHHITTTKCPDGQAFDEVTKSCSTSPSTCICSMSGC